MWSAVRCEFSAKQFQQLPHILLAEGHLFPMVDHQAGDAHDLVLFPQVGEVVQVVDLGGDVRIFRGNALGRRHQFRTSGTGQREPDLIFQQRYRDSVNV